MSDAITVLGAGIVGVSSAIHLQRRGWRVTLVERDEPGGATSFGNAGVVNPASFVPLNSPELHTELATLVRNRSAALRYDPWHVLRTLPWMLAFLRASKTRAAEATARALASLTAPALEEHRALMQRSGNGRRLRERGWLKVYRRPGGHDPAGFAARLYGELGIAVERHDPASLARLEPALKPVFAGGIVLPGGGLIDDPGALVAEHAARFVADGGELRRLDVRRIDDDGERLHCRGAADSLVCERLVIAAGPWSADLLEALGYEVPLGVERGYHAHYAMRGDHPLGRSVHDVDGGYVMGPMTRGLRVTTGVELAARDAPSNFSQLERVEPRLREAIEVGERVGELWRGSRPCLPDSRPLIGPVPRDPRLWCNFGHQHIGLMSGPVSGRLLAELVGGETPVVDPRPFAPSRWLRRRRRARRRS